MRATWQSCSFHVGKAFLTTFYESSFVHALVEVVHCCAGESAPYPKLIHNVLGFSCQFHCSTEE